jgi:Xaa-Pro dipeptidase
MSDACRVEKACASGAPNGDEIETTVLTPETLPLIQAALSDAGLDGWLLFDFRGINPVAAGILQLKGLQTRRIYAYVPRQGVPTAITHAIEQSPWEDWPTGWARIVYSGWRELEAAIASLVRRQRVAMEYSPGDAIPYVDRVPAGVVELVRAAGADVVSSGELISRFYAVLDAEQIAAHRRAAATIADIGRDALRLAGKEAAEGRPMTEYALQRWVLDRFARAGLETVDPPIVAIGPRAANPHYAPSETNSAVIAPGEVLLVDLWAREPGQPYADQTWMGVLGSPTSQTVRVWETVRDARDAAIQFLRERIPAGQSVQGGAVDDVARRVIEARGFGRFFIHRTGHSIDARDIHGSGPHLDNLETREERFLIPGVAFSIEPGIYQAGVLGARSEVNVLVGDKTVEITPADYQRDLMRV